MSKIYLCGITNSKEFDNIKELTDPIWEHVDGLIFGYDPPRKLIKDETKDLLLNRKKGGAIIDRKWSNDHDLQMNTFLRGGILKGGDWFILRDSMERFHPDFAKGLPDSIRKWEFQGIKSVFNYGKGFAFKYNDSMIFQGSPHWGLEGVQGPAIDLKHLYDEDKKEHTWRLRDGEEGGRPIDNKIDHEAKYAWVYGRSNHLLLGMEDSISEYQRAEIVRLHIRDVARTNGFQLTIDGLKEFMIWLQEKHKETFSSFINSHRVWKNFYRYHILGTPFKEIETNENDWRFEG